MDADPSQADSAPGQAVPAAPNNAAPAAPLNPTPAWTGLQLAILVLFALVAVAAITVFVFLAWAILLRATNPGAVFQPQVQLVWMTVVGQAGGLAAGLGLAYAWLNRPRTHLPVSPLEPLAPLEPTPPSFWRAIHLTKLKPETILACLFGGLALTIAAQVLGHYLPMPSDVPMDRLFTPQTAWLLMVYGVAIAPFFEEFYFRGLLYPTLFATFERGLTPGELRSWRPFVRVVSGLLIVAILLWQWREAFLGRFASPQAMLAHSTGLIVVALEFLLFLALVQPDWPLRAAAFLANRLARWHHPDLLAILLTGFLFGLLHAAQLGWAWAAVLVLVLVGVVLTAVRALTGSMTASWLVHCAYNGTLFAAQFVATQGFHNFNLGQH